MQAQTKLHFRVIWLFLIVLISIATLWSGISGVHSPLGAIIGHRWAHFLIYLAVGCIAFLAWKMATALAISFGVAIVSVALQVAKASLAHVSADKHALVVNLFGVAAGVLLGLNILTFRTNAQKHMAAKESRRIQPGA
ncbi:MAG TPA: hypothetical protein VG844_18855 [Terracidiphilus sp.]|jgi:hypothetical protein|nr:hypothetical protein [Terracidiphilus sp.]